MTMQLKAHLFFYVHHIKTKMVPILNFSNHTLHTTVMQEFWFSDFGESHWLILASIAFFTLTGEGKGRELTFSLSIDKPKSICWLSGENGRLLAIQRTGNRQQSLASLKKEKKKETVTWAKSTSGNLMPPSHIQPSLIFEIISSCLGTTKYHAVLANFLGIFNNVDKILLHSPIQAGNCYHSTKYESPSELLVTVFSFRLPYLVHFNMMLNCFVLDYSRPQLTITVGARISVSKQGGC